MQHHLDEIEELTDEEFEQLKREARRQPGYLTFMSTVVLAVLLMQLFCQMWFAIWVGQKLTSVERISIQASLANQRIDTIEFKLNEFMARMPPQSEAKAEKR